MAAQTLTGKSTAGAVIGPITLQGVTESINSETGVENFRIPGYEASAQLLFKLTGATETLRVTGYQSDTSAANVKANFTDKMRALCHGSMSSANNLVTYTSDLYGTVTGTMSDFQATWNPGQVISVNYSFTIFIGTPT